jgi:hypothetical protein
MARLGACCHHQGITKNLGRQTSWCPGPKIDLESDSRCSRSDGSTQTSEDQNSIGAHPLKTLTLILIFFLHRPQFRESGGGGSCWAAATQRYARGGGAAMDPLTKMPASPDRWWWPSASSPEAWGLWRQRLHPRHALRRLPTTTMVSSGKATTSV